MSRDELIDLAEETLYANGGAPGQRFTTRSLAAGFVDAGWRHRPSGDVTRRVQSVLADHNIECTGLGEVTCRGCRERGWMSWSEFREHQAHALADAGLLAG